MIEANRPICAMDTLVQKSYSDPFKDWSKYTLVSSDEEWRQSDDHDHQWESCNAWWSKPNEEATGEFDPKYHYVRCMEPAVWYVSISGNGCGEGPLTYCDYHKPRVRENS